MVTEADNGNGRVTIALLGQKVDDLTALIREMREDYRRNHEAHEARIRELESGSVKRTEQITGLSDDVKALKERDAWGNVTTGIMAVVAGAVGWFKP